jgi:hypothetical protein
MTCSVFGTMIIRNSQMCIVTGPNQDIAIKLIKRMKGLFEPTPHPRFSRRKGRKNPESM